MADARTDVPGAVEDPSRIKGENIEIQQGGATIPCYLARPAEPHNSPALVVIHEAFGPVEHIHDLCRRFANLGYTAIAPNLYARAGAPDASSMPSVMEKMFGLPDAQVVADLTAAAEHARGLPNTNGRVGCIGFCSGGRQSLLFACSNETIDAAVDCWGGFIDRATPDQETTANRPNKPIEMVDKLKGPLFAAFGAEDENPSPQVAEELRQRLRRSGLPHQVKVYPNAGHAFLADYRPSYQRDAAFTLWGDVTTFLGNQLSLGAD